MLQTTWLFSLEAEHKVRFQYTTGTSPTLIRRKMATREVLIYYKRGWSYYVIVRGGSVIPWRQGKLVGWWWPVHTRLRDLIIVPIVNVLQSLTSPETFISPSCRFITHFSPARCLLLQSLASTGAWLS